MRPPVYRNSVLSLAVLMFVSFAAAAAAAPVDQAGFVKLGGIEQWIGIKGERRANPVLLVVHGGPGDVQWPEAAKYLPWERYFTVVQWDQRGAGRTFGRYGKATPNVDLAHISRDGIELAQWLCKNLDKRKIIVLGHSWGSIVAVSMVKARPDLFAAYVGTGQVESWKASVKLQFAMDLAKAKADKDRAWLKQLEAIGAPDPANTHQYFGFNRLLAIMAPSDQAWIGHLRSDPAPRKRVKDFKDLEEGMLFSGEKLLPDQVAEDLSKSATRIDTAFFVIQGKDDHVTPTEAAVDYFNKVEAPHKELVLILDAGHFAFMTSGRLFLQALVDRVRPVAMARGA
ncbi:MAG: alpha/beta fold hydrolase [Rhizomicrobium sp.]